VFAAVASLAACSDDDPSEPNNQVQRSPVPQAVVPPESIRFSSADVESWYDEILPECNGLPAETLLIVTPENVHDENLGQVIRAPSWECYVWITAGSRQPPPYQPRFDFADQCRLWFTVVPVPGSTLGGTVRDGDCLDVVAWSGHDSDSRSVEEAEAVLRAERDRLIEEQTQRLNRQLRDCEGIEPLELVIDADTFAAGDERLVVHAISIADSERCFVTFSVVPDSVFRREPYDPDGLFRDADQCMARAVPDVPRRGDIIEVQESGDCRGFFLHAVLRYREFNSLLEAREAADEYLEDQPSP